MAQALHLHGGLKSNSSFTSRLYDRAIQLAVSGSMNSKDMLSPGESTMAGISPPPSFKQRLIDKAMNLSGGQTFSSFAAGGAVAYQFGPAAGVITGMASYGLCTAVSAFRDYAYRQQTGRYERPDHTYG